MAAVNGLIPVGSRNTELSRFGFSVIKRYGPDDGRARELYEKRLLDCEEPLPEDEANTIWENAIKAWRRKVALDPNYTPPEVYLSMLFGSVETLVPSDYTDLGQAQLFFKIYGSIVRYSPAHEFMVYDGKRFRMDNLAAQRLAQELTDRQRENALKMMDAARIAERNALEAEDDEARARAKAELKRANDFLKYVLNMRTSHRIAATLKEAAPMVATDPDVFDRDACLLNTPSGTYDMMTGEMRPHSTTDLITKCTSVGPSGENRDLWEGFIRDITGGDAALAEFLRIVAGMACIGEVTEERLIVAYGFGGNGKSTFFNAIDAVMGDYAGHVSSDVLMSNPRRNKAPEFAMMQGKRLITASETEEGCLFDSSAIKKLSSTDKIPAAHKFKAPFEFTPSHTCVMHTNHLPRVSSNDRGTWDRLIVIPFKARLRGTNGEIKNYAKYLYEHCGGSILQWMLEGARKFIEAGYKLTLPAVVIEAIEEYRDQNDWLGAFIEDRCEVDAPFSVGSQELYSAYRLRCSFTGEYVRHQSDFKAALSSAGYQWRKSKTGARFYGLRLQAEGCTPPGSVRVFGGPEGYTPTEGDG